ncbi:Protein kinase dsk1 [Sphaceloma murrayae]|uniref:non-specific serine/threonine protein kinase n=1 Tax=Sphaceloma murrayae TaxID=2082308 RepID=A0A2K1QG26_9PEZI|nr:Protein kinase dsk1 [Sphaceloma murrayae]
MVYAMAPQLSLWRRVVTRATQRAKGVQSQEATHVPPDIEIEEELLPGYRPWNYCRIEMGDVFDGRYRVVAKLSYSAEHTTWLCRDQRWGFKMAFDKRGERLESTSISTLQRWRIQGEGLSIGHMTCSRWRVLVVLHQCLIQRPMQTSIFDAMGPPKNRTPLPLDMLKQLVWRLLQGLGYLHTGIGLVHTGERPIDFLVVQEKSWTNADLQMNSMLH